VARREEAVLRRTVHADVGFYLAASEMSFRKHVEREERPLRSEEVGKQPTPRSADDEQNGRRPATLPTSSSLRPCLPGVSDRHHGNASSANSLPIKTSDNPADKVSN
jgi:hypothetical protein